MKALETSVGQVLAERGKPVRPTPSGQVVLRLARQVALATGGEASFSGAAQAVATAVAAAGLDTTGLALSDGSGLSRADQVPARLLVDVVEAAADGSVPDIGSLLSGLPIAGYTGTLADRGDADAGTAPAPSGPRPAP